MLRHKIMSGDLFQFDIEFAVADALFAPRATLDKNGNGQQRYKYLEI